MCTLRVRDGLNELFLVFVLFSCCCFFFFLFCFLLQLNNRVNDLCHKLTICTGYSIWMHVCKCVSVYVCVMFILVLSIFSVCLFVYVHVFVWYYCRCDDDDKKEMKMLKKGVLLVLFFFFFVTASLTDLTGCLLLMIRHERKLYIFVVVVGVSAVVAILWKQCIEQ